MLPKKVISISTTNCLEDSAKTLPGDQEPSFLSRAATLKIPAKQSNEADSAPSTPQFSDRPRSSTLANPNPAKYHTKGESPSATQFLTIDEFQDTAPSSPNLSDHRNRSLRSTTLPSNYHSRDSGASGESSSTTSPPRKLSSILATKGKAFQFDWLRRSAAGKGKVRTNTEIAETEDSNTKYVASDLKNIHLSPLITNHSEPFPLLPDVESNHKQISPSCSKTKPIAIVIDGNMDWLPKSSSILQLTSPRSPINSPTLSDSPQNLGESNDTVDSG